jgi:hypothetical protein
MTFDTEFENNIILEINSIDWSECIGPEYYHPQ